MHNNKDFSGEIIKMRWLWFLFCAVLGSGAAGLRSAGADAPAGRGRRRPCKGPAGTVPRCWKRDRRWRVNRNWARPKCSCRRRGWQAFPGWDRLDQSITNQARQNPAALTWGDDGRVENLFAGNSPVAESRSGAVYRFHRPAGKSRRGARRFEPFAIVRGAGIVAHPFAEQHRPFSAVIVGFGPGLRRGGIGSADCCWITAFDGRFEPRHCHAGGAGQSRRRYPNRWRKR